MSKLIRFDFDHHRALVEKSDGRWCLVGDGLVLGELRLARALRKWLDTFDIDIVCHEDVFDWLIARQKRGKK